MNISHKPLELPSGGNVGKSGTGSADPRPDKMSISLKPSRLLSKTEGKGKLVSLIPELAEAKVDCENNLGPMISLG